MIAGVSRRKIQKKCKLNLYLKFIYMKYFLMSNRVQIYDYNRNYMILTFGDIRTSFRTLYSVLSSLLPDTCYLAQNYTIVNRGLQSSNSMSSGANRPLNIL